MRGAWQGLKPWRGHFQLRVLALQVGNLADTVEDYRAANEQIKDVKRKQHDLQRRVQSVMASMPEAVQTTERISVRSSLHN